LNFLLFLNTVTQPPAGAAQAVADTGAQTSQALGGSAVTTIIPIVLYAIFFIGVMWFMVIRPQKKRENKLKDMMSNIRSGDSVMTNSGFYGKVVDITEECFIVEFGTNRGIRIPVQKSEIAGIKEPNLTVKRYEDVTPTEENK
jgi:preprotein translocase subunit YajC